MKVSNPRWLEYQIPPNAGEYKGFKLKEKKKAFEKRNKICITFTNGEVELTVTGRTNNFVFNKMFDEIDRYEQRRN